VIDDRARSEMAIGEVRLLMTKYASPCEIISDIVSRG